MAGYQPIDSGRHSGPALLQVVHAGADRERWRDATRVTGGERTARQLGTASTCDESDVDSVVDDQPSSGETLYRGESLRQRLKPRSSQSTCAEMKRTALAKDSHHRTGDVDEIATADDVIIRHDMHHRYAYHTHAVLRF
jgi:hypothetical protein